MPTATHKQSRRRWRWGDIAVLFADFDQQKATGTTQQGEASESRKSPQFPTFLRNNAAVEIRTRNTNPDVEQRCYLSDRPAHRAARRAATPARRARRTRQTLQSNRGSSGLDKKEFSERRFPRSWTR